MDIETLAPAVARQVELAAIVVFIGGAVAAVAAFATRLTKRRTFLDAYHGLRADLGRAILLGLELLVMADIIGTVAIAPTFRNLGVLALIVAIRTVLSFVLELEVNGRLPWQRAEQDRKAR